MDKDARTDFISDHMHKIHCLSRYNNRSELLGVGTVGTVFLMCEKKDSSQCHAVKIQLLNSNIERRLFHLERANQFAFSPFAPTIFQHCVQKLPGGREVGVVSMQPIDTELDEYLTKARTSAELRAVVSGITQALKFLVAQRLTHGDLALFNIAYGDGKWQFIDFDRSSTKIYAPAVDILRLISEWSVSSRSQGTKPIKRSNVKFIKKHGLPAWSALFPEVRIPASVGDINMAWEDAYENYCRSAGVLCLDGTAKTPPPLRADHRPLKQRPDWHVTVNPRPSLVMYDDPLPARAISRRTRRSPDRYIPK
jgi:hypothetical protein